MEPKPVTTDPDEQELLKEMGIPLTDPNAETVTPETPETPDETPEVADEPISEPADETPEVAADQPAEDEVVPETKPATVSGSSVDEPVPAVVQAPVADPDLAQLEQLETILLAEDADPFTVEYRRAQIAHNKLSAHIANRPAREYVAQQQETAKANAYWKGFEKTTGIAEGQKVWNDCVAVFQKRGFQGDALHAAATGMFEAKVEGLKGTTPTPVPTPTPKVATLVPPKAVAKTPITPKGAVVVPPTAAPVPPAPKSMTDEEELVAYQRKHVPGGLRALVR